jgi:hypothetical protein
MYNLIKRILREESEEKQSHFDRLLSEFKDKFPDEYKNKIDLVGNHVKNFIKEKGYQIKFLNSCHAGFSGVRTKNQIIICSPINMHTIGDFLYTIYHEIRHEQQISEIKMGNPLMDFDLEDFENLNNQYWEMEMDADKFAKEMIAKMIIKLEIPLDLAKKQFKLSKYIEEYPSSSKMIENQLRYIVHQIKQLRASGEEITDIQDLPMVKRFIKDLESFI